MQRKRGEPLSSATSPAAALLFPGRRVPPGSDVLPLTRVQVPHHAALPRLQPDLVPEHGDVGARVLRVQGLEVGQHHAARAAGQGPRVHAPRALPPHQVPGHAQVVLVQGDNLLRCV